MENKPGDKSVFTQPIKAAKKVVEQIIDKIKTPTAEEIAEAQSEWLRIDNDELFRPIGQMHFGGKWGY